MQEKRRSIEYVPTWKRVGACLCGAALVITLVPGNALAATEPSPPAAAQGQTQKGQPPQPPSQPNGQAPPGIARGAGADTQSFDYSGTYSAAKTADGSEESSSNETLSSTSADQNVALAENGGSLTIENGTLRKSGDSTNADNVNFYGTNSGLLAVGEGSKAYVSNSSVETSSAGSNGVFATDGATVYANDDRITTTSTGGNARGLDATYGGTIVGNALSIDTAGDHCASIATDRGGGNVSLTNSTLATAGSGSPLLYSTGDIEVENVNGTASGSQIAGMEGYNSILISNSSLESTNNAISGSDPVKNGVIIYQSTSGDAETSTGKAAKFTAADSTLKTSIDSGAMFYLTNTSADVVLSNTTLDFDSSKANLLQAEGNNANNWGTAGKNGAIVSFTMRHETASGNITADDISTAGIYLLDDSTWTGAASVTASTTSGKTTSEAPLTINVGSGSTWVVTADSTVTDLNVAKGGKVVDANGKTVTVKTAGKILVSGDSDCAVTVTGSYSTAVATSEANEADIASIDRSDFDSHYGTSTTFGKNTAGTARGASDSVSSSASGGPADTNPIIGFFQRVIEMLTGGSE